MPEIEMRKIDAITIECPFPTRYFKSVSHYIATVPHVEDTFNNLIDFIKSIKKEPPYQKVTQLGIINNIEITATA